MAMQTILDNSFATLMYEDTDRYIYHSFKCPTTGEPLRQLLDTGVDALKAQGATKWLSDDRKKGESSQEDIAYAGADWGPRAAAAGWKYWALVVPEDIAGRASMQDVVNGFFEVGVRVAVFTNVDAARTWLIKNG